MKKVTALRNFFRNGEFIKKGEIILVDRLAYQQLVIEELLCEDNSLKEAIAVHDTAMTREEK